MGLALILAIPVASALADDPSHFLERNAKLQWGIMVCVYGLSHVPALLLLEFPGYQGKSAFLVFFLVSVVQACMVLQHLLSRRLERAAVREESRNYRADRRAQPSSDQFTFTPFGLAVSI